MEVADQVVLLALISGNHNEVLETYLRDSVVSIGREEFLMLLEYEKLSSAQVVLDVSARQTRVSRLSRKTPKFLASSEVIERLIKLVGDSWSSLDALWILSYVRQKDWEPGAIESLCTTFTDMLAVADLESNVIANSDNPLLLTIVAAGYCRKFSGWSLQFKENFIDLAEYFLEVAIKIQKQYAHYRDLQVLYTEKAYGNLCAFDIVADDPEFYRILLQQNIVADITTSLWTGDCNAELGFESCCVALEFIEQFEEVSDLWSIHRKFCEEQTAVSIFQFHLWKHDGSLRYWIETMWLLMLYCWVIYVYYFYLRAERAMLKAELTMDDIDIYLSQVDYIIQVTKSYPVIASLLVLYCLQIFLFKLMLKERISLSTRGFFDLLLLVMTVAINIVQSPAVFPILTSEQSHLILESMYAVLFALLAFRISVVLLQTKVFGPVLRMMYIIFLSIRVYLTIYLFVLFAFSIMFNCLFWREEDFRSLQVTVVTLFAWCVGGPDPSAFTARQEIGCVLLVLWCFVSAIFVLNLLIAVLSDKYEQLVRLATADYVAVIYEHYSQTRYDKNFGALVIAPVPSNWISLPLLPVLLWCPKQRQLVTRVVAVASYQGMFFIGLICFLLYNALLSVTTYLYMIYRIPKTLGRWKVWLIVPWLLFSPPYLVYLTGRSMCYWFTLMYRPIKSVQPNVAEYDAVLKHCTRLRKFLNKQPYMQLEDISLTWRRFPGKHFSFTPRSSTYGKCEGMINLVEKIYFSRKVSKFDSKERDIAAVFERFKSYSQEHDGPGCGQINIDRLCYWLRRLENNPSKLRAMNIFYVQKALQLTYNYRDQQRKEVNS